MKSLSAIALLVPLLSLPCLGVEVIENVTATATSDWASGAVSIDNLVNNTGIRTAGSTPGNESPASYEVDGVHTFNGGATDQWHTNTGDPTPTVTFDLGGSFDLDAIHIWNGNQSGLTTRGVQQFDILVSTDGSNYTEVLSDQVLSQAPGGTYIPAEVFDLTGNNGVTHVQLRVDSNYGDAFTGLSEVMFTYPVDPNLDVAGSFDFGTISALQTVQLGVPISNEGLTQSLNISDVSVTGADASFFTVDNFPATLAAGGGSGSIDITFDPDGFDGPFSAVLEITSDSTGSAGTVSEVILTATAAPDPGISAAPAFGFPFIHPDDTFQALIPVENLGLTQPLSISNVSITGADAASFTVDSFPASIAAASSDTIAVTFDPSGIDGDFEASLEITSNDSGIPGFLTTVDLTAATNLLAGLSSPTITAAASAFSGDFVASHLFDSRVAEYSSAGAGAGTPFSQADGTWVELDFGAPVEMDRFILVARANSSDIIDESRLILSDDPVFDATDTIFTFNPTGQNGEAPIQSLPTTTARYARWEVASFSGGANLGGMEMRFLDTPAGWLQAPVTVIDGSPAFSAEYALANAANGDAGRNVSGNPVSEYASAGAGTGMFVDFDFGASLPLVGVDFFDRIGVGDRTTSFNLLFSDDPTFGTGVTTVTINPGSDNWGLRRSFPEVTARYARFEALAVTGGNSGMQEIIFYSAAGAPSGTAYEQYITDTWGISGGDAAPDADFDRDGLANAIEFVLGSDPGTADPSVAPGSTLDPGNLSFTFRRSQDAAGDTPTVQYGSDLIGWTNAVDGVDGISISVTPDGFEPGVDSVTVVIPRSLEISDRLFARLAVTVAVTP